MRNRTSLGASPMLLAALGVLSPACNGQTADQSQPGSNWQPLESEINGDREAGSPSALHPFLNCVERGRDGDWVAHFGYQNDAAEALVVAVGPSNSFHPSPQDRGQPSSFAPGRHDGAVRLELSSKAQIQWRLGTERAVASQSSPECTSGVFCGDRHVDCKVDSQGVLQCEQCDDGNVEGADGCSARCITEPGWVCSDPGAPCRRPTCGDGRQDCAVDFEHDGAWRCEMCDDGNVTSGDGCSSTCHVEPEWACPNPGQSCYPSRCGDGRTDCYTDSGGTHRCEQCDDGNVQPGDGCAPDCTAEPGWLCEAPPTSSCYFPRCGDGHIDCYADAAGSWLCEACDDGNVRSGDGCSSACGLERGWVCNTAGSPCRRPRCGDGKVDDYTDAKGSAKTEECDDGNRRARDGCSSSCTLETGWVCPKPGSPCRVPTCGDGIVEAYTNAMGEWVSEQCDDGNDRSGDACSAACTVEPGWTCYPPEIPTEIPCHRVICGDGNLDWYSDESSSARYREGCDDGNTLAGDGCSASCTTEPGWICKTPGLACDRQCGNGRLDSTASEQCDDGNVFAGDGCSSACTIELGWVCGDEGQPCHRVTCGDGIMGCYTGPDAGKVCEQCDDANTNSGDGCSATCVVEPGWICDNAGSPCQYACGNGRRDSPEQCDDGNSTPGDGCSATCTREPYYVCEAAGQACHRVVCGDGRPEGYYDETGSWLNEQCDDGNLQAGDGCSPNCTVEAGWHCQTDRCGSCGDGHMDDGFDAVGTNGFEECDDGNALDGDGCSALCQVEPNWTCSRHKCLGPCGDGKIDCLSIGDRSECEACDDGNVTDGDGCSATCQTEMEPATGLCTEDHWCWLNPQPQGVPLAAGWASPDGSIWAVGDQVVLRTTGPRWSYVSPRVARKLMAISGTSSTDVWAVGQGILHWNGTTWVDMSYVQSGATAVLNSVWAVAPGNAWAVGPAGLVLHWDGSAWSEFEAPIAPGVTPAPDLRKVWASSSNEVWVLGSDRALHHWDGAVWSAFSPFADPADFWAFAPNDVWVVNTDGMLTRWNGVQWVSPFEDPGIPVSLTELNYGSSVSAISGTSDSEWLWAAGRDHYSLGFMAGIPIVDMSYGSAMSMWPTSGSLEAWPLTSVVVANRRNVWAFGQGASMTHFDGSHLSTWSKDLSLQGNTSPFYQDPFLRAAWSDSPNNVWVVGGYYWSDLGLNIGCGRSHAAHWDGQTWSAGKVLTAGSLTDIVATGPNDIWVVADWAFCNSATTLIYEQSDSGLFHWNGSDWAKAGDQTLLAAQWASSPSDLWVAGNGYVPPRDGIPETTASGSVLHWTGTEWATVDTGLITSASISGTGPDDIWVVGADQAGPKLVHWDGTAWAGVPQQPSPDASIPMGGLPYGTVLKKIVAASRDAVWLATDTGLLLWNGAIWQSAPAPFVPYSLAGGPGAGVIAIDGTNRVVRHD